MSNRRPLTSRLSPHDRTLRFRVARITCLLIAGVTTLAAWRPLTPSTRALDVTSRRQAVVVVGTIRDAGTQSALGGVSVGVTVAGALGASGQSAADGRYTVTLSSVQRGATLTVIMRRLGYAPWRTTVSASADTVRLDALLQPTNQALSSVTVTSDAIALGRGVAGGIAKASMPSPATVSGVGLRQRAMNARESDRRYDERRPRSVMDSSRPVDWNREQYDRILDNPFLGVRGNPRSTFSVDVDRASYGNIRRFITQGQLPPADAVRIEELVNYFSYDLAEPRDDAPVAITTEAMPAPWQTRHQLVRVALQARRIDTDKLPPSNLVFLIDVSGSMMSPDKLPLVKQSLRLLVEQLRPQDQVALVVYAGAAGLALPSTAGDQKSRIMESIDRLEAGGSTAGGAGLELAYRTARDHFERGGNNRVILCTDGDFNVGPSSDAAMERLIESKRAEGTYLTVLGFGTGNYQDAKMEKIAKIGNGNYAYIDEIGEANKVLVKEMGGTLVTVANDVKLQIEFNPARVAAYRLIGYEDRILRDEDFRDDKKDAGDMGAGHSVTALYEIVPVGVKGTVTVRDSDPLRYAQDGDTPRRTASDADELLHVSLRYKRPGESTSKLITKAVRAGNSRERASDDLRFASAVASFGMLLRNSEYKGTSTGADVLALARGAADHDTEGYRADFIRLVNRWQELSRNIAARPGNREP